MAKIEVTAELSPAKDQAGLTADRPTLIAFLIFVLIGGTAAIAVRSIFSQLAPFWGGALRFGLAALIFWGLVLIRRVSLPRGRALAGAALFGLLAVGVAMPLGYFALTETPAGLFQTIIAIVPLLTLVFAWLHKQEQLKLRSIGGGVLAMAGIALALSGSLSAGVEISLPHIIAAFAAAACFSEAGVVAKMFPGTHPIATNAIAMTIGGSILLVVSLFSGETWVLPSTADIWLTFAYLVIAATVGTFLLYLFILGRWTASGAAYSFVLTPIVTIILGSVLLDEPITAVFLAGCVLVLLGVYLGALRPARKQTPVPVEEDVQSRPGQPTCV